VVFNGVWHIHGLSKSIQYIWVEEMMMVVVVIVVVVVVVVIVVLQVVVVVMMINARNEHTVHVNLHKLKKFLTTCNIFN
jgi:signal transduction histidine kinase